MVSMIWLILFGRSMRTPFSDPLLRFRFSFFGIFGFLRIPLGEPHLRFRSVLFHYLPHYHHTWTVVLRHRTVVEDQAAIAARNRQQLEQRAKDRLPVQFPQLPSHAEIQQLANNNDNDETGDSDIDNAAVDEEHHPIYWREQQQQPLNEWLAAHPDFHVTL